MYVVFLVYTCCSPLKPTPLYFNLGRILFNLGDLRSIMCYSSFSFCFWFCSCIMKTNKLEFVFKVKS